VIGARQKHKEWPLMWVSVGPRCQGCIHHIVLHMHAASVCKSIEQGVAAASALSHARSASASAARTPSLCRCLHHYNTLAHSDRVASMPLVPREDALQPFRRRRWRSLRPSRRLHSRRPLHSRWPPPQPPLQPVLPPASPSILRLTSPRYLGLARPRYPTDRTWRFSSYPGRLGQSIRWHFASAVTDRARRVDSRGRGRRRRTRW
jgi:hypothetical protein